MRKGKIRFPLKLKDDAEARSLEELRENFDLERIIQYYSDGSLERWLDCWMLTDEADKVRALDKADKAIGRALCEIFGVEPPEGTVDAEDIAWRTERENRLKQYTDDKEILAKVDFVAFDTEDLYDILEEEDTDIIYLCNNSFNFNSSVLKHKNKRYIGIGKAEAVIGSKAPVDFEGLGVAFENVKFDEAYNAIEKNDKETKDDESKECAIFIANINGYIKSYENSSYLMFQFKSNKITGRILRKIDEKSYICGLNTVLSLQNGETFLLFFKNTEIGQGELVQIADSILYEDVGLCKHFRTSTVKSTEIYKYDSLIALNEENSSYELKLNGKSINGCVSSFSYGTAFPDTDDPYLKDLLNFTFSIELKESLQLKMNDQVTIILRSGKSFNTKIVELIS